MDHLDAASKKALLDYFNSPETVARVTAQWEASSEEGMHALRELLDRERFPEGPQLCYPLGLDVRVSATLTPTATPTRTPVAQIATPTTVPSHSPTAVVVTTEPSPTATTAAEGDIDVCGNAVGNGNEIVSGPSEPGANDRDSVFRSLTVHPTNPDIVLMGTERNGFVKSTDGGATWTRYRQGLRWLPGIGYPEIYDIAISPNDPNIVLAATVDSPGPVTGNFPSSVAGIYKSIDGGETWVRRNCGLTNSRVVVSGGSVTWTPDGSTTYEVTLTAGGETATMTTPVTTASFSRTDTLVFGSNIEASAVSTAKVTIKEN